MNYTSATDFTGRTRWVYQELRDRKVALFIDNLPEGVWQLSYEMRAEVPGSVPRVAGAGPCDVRPRDQDQRSEVRCW